MFPPLIRSFPPCAAARRCRLALCFSKVMLVILKDGTAFVCFSIQRFVIILIFLKMEDKLQHQLWVGSANATQRAWAGRNFEVVAHLKLKRDVAEGLLEFVNQCQIYL